MTIHSNLKIIGVNIQGWVTQNRKEKNAKIRNLLIKEEPDIFLIAESALNDQSNLLVPHDDYEIKQSNNF